MNERDCSSKFNNVYYYGLHMLKITNIHSNIVKKFEQNTRIFMAI
jgi:hypothetical protein